MAPRAHWKGFLKLSLVSCPIALYPAISAADKISFRQVNRETGNRVRQQLVDTVTGEVVASHNKGRGYEVGENDFLIVPDEELAAAQQEARERPFSAALAQPEAGPASRGTSTPPEKPLPRARASISLAEREAENAPPIIPRVAPPR